MTHRNKSLDVLRGMAVLLVLGRHYPSSPWEPIGWWGVDLFFVLSGFLISGLLFRDVQLYGELRLKRFWLRRGWKIWPAFFVYLIVVTVLVRLPGHQFWWASLFLTDYIYRGGILGHTWSLSVEEHFYIILPLLLLWLSPRRFAAIPFISLGVLITSPLLRCFGSLELANFATHTRIDGLLAGVAVGYLYHFKPRAFRHLAKTRRAIPVFIACSAIAILLGDPVDNRIPAIFSFSVLAIGFSFLVAWAVVQECPKLLWPVATIGFYSYSIYLWHMLFASMLPFVNFRGKQIVYLLVCLCMGTTMSVLIEVPCVRLRDKIWKEQGRRYEKNSGMPLSAVSEVS